MKHIIVVVFVLIGLVVNIPSTALATPEMEKAFIDAYKKAFEAKDEAALKGLLYTKGADPEILEFYTMMMTGDMGGKITSIELRDLTAEDKKKASEIQPLPNGQDAKLVLNPVKKLVLKISSGGAEGSSTSTSESFVAEHDGKFVIPVPGPVK